MSNESGSAGGEVGETVLYVCPSGHNATYAVCDPGDVHPAIVAEVLNRDADGRPQMALLALLTPQLPTLQWVQAQRAQRSPGAGDVVTRLTRGRPPAEAASVEATENNLIYVLDYPVGTWHPRGE